MITSFQCLPREIIEMICQLLVDVEDPSQGGGDRVFRWRDLENLIKISPYLEDVISNAPLNLKLELNSEHNFIASRMMAKLKILEKKWKVSHLFIREVAHDPNHLYFQATENDCRNLIKYFSQKIRSIFEHSVRYVYFSGKFENAIKMLAVLNQFAFTDQTLVEIFSYGCPGFKKVLEYPALAGYVRQLGFSDRCSCIISPDLLSFSNIQTLQFGPDSGFSLADLSNLKFLKHVYFGERATVDLQNSNGVKLKSVQNLELWLDNFESNLSGSGNLSNDFIQNFFPNLKSLAVKSAHSDTSDIGQINLPGSCENLSVAKETSLEHFCESISIKNIFCTTFNGWNGVISMSGENFPLLTHLVVKDVVCEDMLDIYEIIPALFHSKPALEFINFTQFRLEGTGLVDPIQVLHIGLGFENTRRLLQSHASLKCIVLGNILAGFKTSFLPNRDWLEMEEIGKQFRDPFVQLLPAPIQFVDMTM